MVEHRAVDVDFIENARARVVVRQAVGVDADTLFAFLADAASWQKWLLDDVRWTTPLPRSVGTTRTIRMGPLKADERFILWQDGRRFAFYFERSTVPMFAAFAEDYVIEELGGGRSELVWTMAFELKRPFGLLHRPVAAAMGHSNQRALRRMALAVESPSRR